MYLSNRLYVITGLVLIAITVCLVLTIGTGIASSSENPTSKVDTAKFLKDVYDNHSTVIVSLFFGVVLDSGLTLIIGGLMYLLFRDRSSLLAMTFLIAFIGAAIMSAVSDGIDASVIVLAKDFVHGGAGLNAGDPAILEIAHVLQVVSSLISASSGTMLAVAFLALGWVIARAPAGKVNPPSAIGWIIIVDGFAQLLVWASFGAEALGFLSFIIFGLTTLVFTLWLGYWLISNSSKLPSPEAMAA